MKDNLPRYTLRINRFTLDKISFIARCNGRTLNKELEQMIKKRIKVFEDTCGEIDLALAETGPEGADADLYYELFREWEKEPSFSILR